MRSDTDSTLPKGPKSQTIAAMTATIDSNTVKDWAKQLGFDAAGVAPAEPISHSEYLRDWLADGLNGQMGYLAKNLDKRIDPAKLMPSAKSIICLGLGYFAESAGPVAKKDTGRIARYAWGRDYHIVVKEKLRQLAERIAQAAPANTQTRSRCFVDTAPIAEKAHAARAGLGWIGKNSLLINERLGSWFVLGEIVTSLELQYDKPVANQCGDCQRCLEACPTAALTGQQKLDAKRCISYLTVELNGRPTGELAEKTNSWIFGCDICQEVCPFNQGPIVKTSEPKFQTARNLNGSDLQSIKEELNWLDEDGFRQRFADTAILRTGREHLLEMVEIAIENTSDKNVTH